eukprot:365042-Chlamydomonas_euryale.AAC.21
MFKDEATQGRLRQDRVVVRARMLQIGQQAVLACARMRQQQGRLRKGRVADKARMFQVGKQAARAC